MGSGRPNITCQNFTDFYDTIYDAVYAALVQQSGVGSVGFNVISTFNRPADNNAYSASDWVSNSTSVGTGFTFNLPVNGTQFIDITDIRLIINQNSVPSGMGDFRLWFYSNTQTFNDNAQAVITYANEADLGVGSCTLGLPVDYGSCLISDPSSISFYTQQYLFVGLETTTAWTPSSGTSFLLQLQGRIF
jgi:hypothetical protein